MVSYLQFRIDFNSCGSHRLLILVCTTHERKTIVHAQTNHTWKIQRLINLSSKLIGAHSFFYIWNESLYHSIPTPISKVDFLLQSESGLWALNSLLYIAATDFIGKSETGHCSFSFSTVSIVITGSSREHCDLLTKNEGSRSFRQSI